MTVTKFGFRLVLFTCLKAVLNAFIYLYLLLSVGFVIYGFFIFKLERRK